jgi:hypothetical protein
MNIYHKIDWKPGMEITASTFIEAEKYHLFQHKINRKLATLKSYGLLPNTRFECLYTVNGDTLQVEDLQCEAITRNGSLLQIKNEFSIAIPEIEVDTLYLVAQIEGFSPVEIDNVPYMELNYYYTFKMWEELSNGNVFPLLKLTRYDGGWREMNYIPPAIALNSHKELKNKHQKAIKLIDEIMAVLKEKNVPASLLYYFSLFSIELKFYTTDESPFEFLLLLKKILRTIELYTQDLKDKLRNLLESTHDPNGLAEVLQEIISSLSEFNELLQTKPVEPPKEDPIEDAFLL